MIAAPCPIDRSDHATTATNYRVASIQPRAGEERYRAYKGIALRAGWETVLPPRGTR